MQEGKLQELEVEFLTQTSSPVTEIARVETISESSTQVISKTITEIQTETNLIQKEELSSHVKKSTEIFQFMSENNFKSEEEFNFKSKGKYTKQVISTIIKRSDEFTQSGFSFQESGVIKCDEHLNSSEYIVLQPFGKFKKHQAICNECQSEYLRDRKEAGINDWEGCKLYTDIIRDFGAKILEIRNGQVSLTNASSVQKYNDMLYEQIIPLADELIEICEEFYEEVSSKFDGSSQTSNEELIIIKKFIDEIPLVDGVKPKVHKIGDNPELKTKYVKLAIFLLNFEGIKESEDLRGVSLKLKQHIRRIIELRRGIVVQITKWLRFILGGFYDLVFRTEGQSVDEFFRQNVKIDFSSEEDIKKITKYFEAEIIKKDARIIMLEEEVARLQRQLDELRGDLSFKSDQETIIEELRIKLSKLDAEWSVQKNTIANLTMENQRLITQSSSYLKEIENLRIECDSLKKNFENKLNNVISEITKRYETQISSFKIEINEWHSKFSNIESKYLSESKHWVSERDSLSNRIQILIQQNTQEINSYKEKISVHITEINNLNLTIQNVRKEIFIITQERDNYARTLEQLKIEIQGYTTNITSITNQYNIIIKSRDDLNYKISDLSNQLNQANAKINQYTSEIEMLNQKIEVFVNNINMYTREKDDLRNQIFIIRGELDKKSAELQTIINIRVNLDNRVGQLENEIRKISEVYQKVNFELNQKVLIINDWEKKLRESDTRNQNLQSQIDIYISKIQNVEGLMAKINEEYMMKVNQLEKLISELREKEREQMTIISQRDNEVQRLKNTVTTCKEEWLRLSESYESLIIDIRNQLSINEHLKNKLSELIRRIEIHNQNVTSMDSTVKQQIEVLTRHLFMKKVIDLEQDFNKDVSNSNSNIETIRKKLTKIESQKLNKSGVFNNLNISTMEHEVKNSIFYQNTGNVSTNIYRSESAIFSGNTGNTGNTSNRENTSHYHSNSGFRFSNLKNENSHNFISNLGNKSIASKIFKATNDYKSVERRNANNTSNRLAKSVVKNIINKSDFFSSENDD